MRGLRRRWGRGYEGYEGSEEEMGRGYEGSEEMGRGGAMHIVMRFKVIFS